MAFNQRDFRKDKAKSVTLSTVCGENDLNEKSRLNIFLKSVENSGRIY